MRDLSREQLLTELRALRPEFERRGVIGLSLFGSRARGDNRPDSDLDLIFELAPSGQFSGFGVAGLWSVIQGRVGLEPSIIVRSELDREPEFRDRIAKDEVAVFG